MHHMQSCALSLSSSKKNITNKSKQITLTDFSILFWLRQPPCAPDNQTQASGTVVSLLSNWFFWRFESKLVQFLGITCNFRSMHCGDNQRLLYRTNETYFVSFKKRQIEEEFRFITKFLFSVWPVFFRFLAILFRIQINEKNEFRYYCSFHYLHCRTNGPKQLSGIFLVGNQ